MNKAFILIIFSLLLITSALALPVEQVRLTSYVNDYANIISPEDEQSLSNIAKTLQDNEVAELAIVTVDNFDGLTREEYAIEIAHEGLGDTQEDNGLLILVGLEEREYRVEVGYGLEGDLNDAKVGRLAREHLVPSFQQGEYGQGLGLLSQALANEILPENATQSVFTQPQYEERSGGFPAWILFLIVFFIIRTVSYRNEQKKYKGKDRNNEDFEEAFTTAAIASMFFRGGGRGGMGGSGGFGGFGGGGFGGGGMGGNF